jgi:hypothetical protein
MSTCLTRFALSALLQSRLFSAAPADVNFAHQRSIFTRLLAAHSRVI